MRQIETAAEFAHPTRHLIECRPVRLDVVRIREFPGIVVAQSHLIVFAPDEDTERQFDPDSAVVLHQRSPASWIAEQHDLFVVEIGS